MAQNFKIDVQATFAAPPLFLQVQPKKKFGSETQEVSADGSPKWEVHVLGMFSVFGGASIVPEVLKIGFVGQNPAQGIAPNTPVAINGLEIGVMEKTKKDQNGQERIVGVTVWHRAESLHSMVAAPAAPSTSKAA